GGERSLELAPGEDGRRLVRLGDAALARGPGDDEAGQVERGGFERERDVDDLAGRHLDALLQREIPEEAHRECGGAGGDGLEPEAAVEIGGLAALQLAEAHGGAGERLAGGGVHDDPGDDATGRLGGRVGSGYEKNDRCDEGVERDAHSVRAFPPPRTTRRDPSGAAQRRDAAPATGRSVPVTIGAASAGRAGSLRLPQA